MKSARKVSLANEKVYAVYKGVLRQTAEARRIYKAPSSRCHLGNRRLLGRGRQRSWIPTMRRHSFRVIMCFIIFCGERVNLHCYLTLYNSD